MCCQAHSLDNNFGLQRRRSPRRVNDVGRGNLGTGIFSRAILVVIRQGIRIRQEESDGGRKAGAVRMVGGITAVSNGEV